MQSVRKLESVSRIHFKRQLSARPGLKSVGTTVDTFKFFDNNLTFGTGVEVQLGKHLQVFTIKLVYI